MATMATPLSVSQKAYAQSRQPDVEASRRYDPTACIEEREGGPLEPSNAEIHATRPPKHYIHANRLLLANMRLVFKETFAEIL